MIKKKRWCIIMENSQKKGYGIMRLYNIFYLCEAYYHGLLLVKAELVESSNGSYYELSNWSECKKSLEELSKIECLAKYAKAIYESLSPLERDKEKPNVAPEKYEIFYTHLDRLRCAVETLRTLNASLKMGEAQSGIDVKIPKCDSLDEYMWYLKEINFIFTQCPYLLCKDETVKFNTVDVGSQWLSFVVEVTVTAAGVFYIFNNLAKLVERAVAIKSDFLLLEQLEEDLKSRQLKNEVTEETMDVFKKFKQDLMDECIDGMEHEIEIKTEPEERARAEKSVEKMVFLIDKGVEIYSSIETPNEIKKLFPFEKEKVMLSEDILKLIEDKAGKMKSSSD